MLLGTGLLAGGLRNCFSIFEITDLSVLIFFINCNTSGKGDKEYDFQSCYQFLHIHTKFIINTLLSSEAVTIEVLVTDWKFRLVYKQIYCL